MAKVKRSAVGNIKLNFYNYSTYELTPMQSSILYELVIKTISDQYGTDRIENIITAFDGDTAAILKCGISLLSCEVNSE